MCFPKNCNKVTSGKLLLGYRNGSIAPLLWSSVEALCPGVLWAELHTACVRKQATSCSQNPTLSIRSGREENQGKKWAQMWPVKKCQILELTCGWDKPTWFRLGTRLRLLVLYALSKLIQLQHRCHGWLYKEDNLLAYVCKLSIT
jgi:hypothetical protein